MKRRIFAWVLLAGFLLLLLNLIIFRFYWQSSMAMYLVIIFAFLITNGKLFRNQNQDKYSSGSYDDPDGNDGEEIDSGPGKENSGNSNADNKNTGSNYADNNTDNNNTNIK